MNQVWYLQIGGPYAAEKKNEFIYIAGLSKRNITRASHIRGFKFPRSHVKKLSRETDEISDVFELHTLKIGSL